MTNYAIQDDVFNTSKDARARGASLYY